MVVEAAGITDGKLYITGPNAEMNTTGLVEYNIRFDSGSIEQRLLACKNAMQLIPGVEVARLTRSYKMGGFEYGRRIKICFADRADGTPAQRSIYSTNRRYGRIDDKTLLTRARWTEQDLVDKRWMIDMAAAYSI
jgi:hypothetical protein